MSAACTPARVWALLAAASGVGGVAFQAQVRVVQGHRGRPGALLAQVIDQQVAGDAEQEGAGVAQHGDVAGTLQAAQAQIDLLTEVRRLVRRTQTAMKKAAELRGVLLEQVVGAHGIARLSNKSDNDS